MRNALQFENPFKHSVYYTALYTLNRALIFLPINEKGNIYYIFLNIK